MSNINVEVGHIH